MHQSSSKNFQPELLMNSEPKADEMHVSPGIANALVIPSLVKSAVQILPVEEVS